MSDKSSALVRVRVVDGRAQHIHDRLRAKLRRMEADLESESLLSVLGRHDRQRQRFGLSYKMVTANQLVLTGYAASPLGFIFRYIRLRPISHLAILGAVLAAVACSVCTQYGIKFLVDTLTAGANSAVWTAFFLLGSLIAADNLLWRVASWIANHTFVGVTGDLRRDLFHHLMGHSPSYFSERLPGTLTSRVTATSNAVFTAENMFVWNVLPPCTATVHAIVTITLTLGLVAWAIRLWERDEATTGDVVLACTLALSVLNATRDLAVALVDVTQHIARLSEAVATLLVPHELKDHPEAEPLIRRGASVKFDHVDFTYPDGQQIFQNFLLNLMPGERVGLVGHSGGGKSTLFALLQRFYDIQGGQILLDGQNIAHVTQESLRDAIGVVPQDISMFHRSVMENIRYGRQEATDDEVMQAAFAARCDFIEKLPQGTRTIVGERGVRLSGGQRQRIAIARAFLKDVPLLLLDEATSALDSESEEAIRQALTRLMTGRTVIAIAHRLSTVQSFDRIVVLQAGRVVQDGSPDLLMRHEGLYRQLVQREIDRLAQQAA